MTEIALTPWEKIANGSVIGALCLLLMVVIIVRERWWQAREKDLTATFTADLKAERASHDKTRDALLDEVRSNGDTIALVRGQLQSQKEAFDTLIMLRKENA
jgi:hypothetical protein